jgi:hypothetical protein
MTSFTRLSAVALLVAAVGIVLQILGGTDYPVVPPDLLILVVAGGFVWFAPWRWAPVVALVVGVFMVVGLFVADQAERLIDAESALDTTGLWLQMVALVVSISTGALALKRSPAPTSR